MRSTTKTSRRPSAGIIIAVVALVLGITGSAVAGSGVLDKGQVKKVSNKQITKRAPGLAVASAKAADSAKDAAKLGGVAADGYVRACDAGAIKASVVMPTAQLPANQNYVSVPGFNCAGGEVQVRRTGSTGTYFVRFVGNPGTGSGVVSASSESAALQGNAIAATVERVNDGTINEAVFMVKTYEVEGAPPNGGSVLENDARFTLLAF
jgi:hypothetical protein